MSGYRQKLIKLWNDWQLSVLVLLSLSLQLLLLATAGFRRRTRPTSWRTKYFWVIHIGSRFVATYSLGILSRASAGDADADIQAFWAAFLLLHLGGPDDFTALSLEDNKLWDRRCFEVFIQALTSVYVFIRYFLDPEFRRFILPFWLILLAALVKCVEQVAALQQATMEALLRRGASTDAGPDYADTIDRFYGLLRSGVLPSLNIQEERVDMEQNPSLNINEERVDLEQNSARMECHELPRSGPASDFAEVAVQDPEPITHVYEIVEIPEQQDPRESDEIIRSGTGTEHNQMRPRLCQDKPNPANDPVSHENHDRPPLITHEEGVKIIRSAHTLFSTFKILFADGIFSFKDRKESQAEFLGKDKMSAWRAFKIVEIELSFVYDMLYTKASVSRTNLGLVIRVASLLLTLSGSLWALFFVFRENKYRLRNRCVTYTLLAGAVLTDVVILAAHVRSIWSLVDGSWVKCFCPAKSVNWNSWSGFMAQSNLITFCLQKLPPRSPRSLNLLLDALNLPPGAKAIILAAWEIAYRMIHTMTQPTSRPPIGLPLEYISRRILEQLRSRSFWKDYKKVKYVPVQQELKELIFSELSSKAEEAKTPDGYKQFTACWGDWVLNKNAPANGLLWSVQRKEFDESLLIWHIATDLCFRQEVNQDASANQYRGIARELSNYLLYIMVVHPLMLPSSTIMATKRFKDTCAETRRHFLKKHFRDREISETEAHEVLLEVKTPLQASYVKGDKSKSVLWDGCFLATELAKINWGANEKWQVICKVWVEMLCYAGVQCGGYYHAERLKEGGELITFACLLMTHLGMGKHYRTEVGDAHAHLSPYTS